MNRVASFSSDQEIAVTDWGTSSFRLWALRPDGTVRAKISRDCGMSTLKPDQFQNALESALTEIAVPKTALVVICGMAGAAQGWIEAPYMPLPASAESLAKHAIRVPESTRPVFIVPGLSQAPDIAPDVMRGEETLLLGLILRHGASGSVCLPGTHSKWATVHDGKIVGFQTSMTGELFSLLSKHSTLSHFLREKDDKIELSDAFRTAVGEALTNPQRILQSLFSIRAMPLLLGKDVAIDMPARLSGLLIGLEIAAQDISKIGPVTLVSHGNLGAAYEAALEIAGIKFIYRDSEELVRVGLLRILQDILTS